jgi:hypothetical protein
MPTHRTDPLERKNLREWVYSSVVSLSPILSRVRFSMGAEMNSMFPTVPVRRKMMSLLIFAKGYFSNLGSKRTRCFDTIDFALSSSSACLLLNWMIIIPLFTVGTLRNVQHPQSAIRASKQKAKQTLRRPVSAGTGGYTQKLREGLLDFLHATRHSSHTRQKVTNHHKSFDGEWVNGQ